MDGWGLWYLMPHTKIYKIIKKYIYDHEKHIKLLIKENITMMGT